VKFGKDNNRKRHANERMKTSYFPEKGGDSILPIYNDFISFLSVGNRKCWMQEQSG